jgi:hypothetical protein
MEFILSLTKGSGQAPRNPGVSKTEKGDRARSAPLCLASLSLIPGFHPGYNSG